MKTWQPLLFMSFLYYSKVRTNHFLVAMRSMAQLQDFLKFKALASNEH